MQAVFLSKWHFKVLTVKPIVSMKELYIFVFIYSFVIFFSLMYNRPTYRKPYSVCLMYYLDVRKFLQIATYIKYFDVWKK